MRLRFTLGERVVLYRAKPVQEALQNSGCEHHHYYLYLLEAHIKSAQGSADWMKNLLK